MNSSATTCTESLGHTSSLNRPFQAAQPSGLAKGEDALLARLRHGDEGAFDELVNRHHGALIRMAMSHVGDREVAEEVVQDTWMAVIESLDRFECRSSLRTWIFGILIHKAKDRGVREKRHTTFSAFESHDDDNEDPPDTMPSAGTQRRPHRQPPPPRHRHSPPPRGKRSRSGWRVNPWVKKGILLGVRMGSLADMSIDVDQDEQKVRIFCE